MKARRRVGVEDSPVQQQPQFVTLGGERDAHQVVSVEGALPTN